jgi:hypothetical protein
VIGRIYYISIMVGYFSKRGGYIQVKVGYNPKTGPACHVALADKLPGSLS